MPMRRLTPVTMAVRPDNAPLPDWSTTANSLPTLGPEPGLARLFTGSHGACGVSGSYICLAEIGAQVEMHGRQTVAPGDRLPPHGRLVGWESTAWP
jgi:hypothetical protein